jgi:hypothetical protein
MDASEERSDSGLGRPQPAETNATPWMFAAASTPDNFEFVVLV